MRGGGGGKEGTAANRWMERKKEGGRGQQDGDRSIPL